MNFQELRDRRDRLYPQVRDMRENGWPEYAVIAQRFGLPVSTVKLWCRDLKKPGVKRGLRGKNIAAAQKREFLKPRACELAATTTMTWVEMATALGVSEVTVRTWCKDVTRPDGCRRKIVDATGYEDLNRDLLRKGIRAPDRARVINDLRSKEMRHAA